MIELYFAPGACSFVPHVALERVKAATGQAFEPRLVKLHKNEQRSPEYLALNPNGQVPTLVVDCDWLDRAFPAAGLLPADSWARAGALSQLAWMNNTVHPTFTRIFRSAYFVESETAQGELKRKAVADFRGCLERIQEWTRAASPYWFGGRIAPHDAYAFTFLRWGGYGGIDPKGLPGYLAYLERVMAEPSVAAVLERERIKLDTYKG